MINVNEENVYSGTMNFNLDDRGKKNLYQCILDFTQERGAFRENLMVKNSLLHAPKTLELLHRYESLGNGLIC